MKTTKFNWLALIPVALGALYTAVEPMLKAYQVSLPDNLKPIFGLALTLVATLVNPVKNSGGSV